MPLSRRAFLGFAAVAPLAATAGCTPATVEERLSSVLGLSPDQRAWVEELTPDDRQYLLDVLTGQRGEADRRARRILFQLFGRRDRLFAFAADASLAPRRGACDGLLRE